MRKAVRYVPPISQYIWWRNKVYLWNEMKTLKLIGFMKGVKFDIKGTQMLELDFML
jgi:hypothetical protein